MGPLQQIMTVQGGVKTPPKYHQNSHFLAKTLKFDSFTRHLSHFFSPVPKRGVLGNIWHPYEPFKKNSEGPGGPTTPPKQTPK